MGWEEEFQGLNSEEHNHLQSRQRNRVAKGFKKQWQYVSEVRGKTEVTPVLKTKGNDILKKN